MIEDALKEFARVVRKRASTQQEIQLARTQFLDALAEREKEIKESTTHAVLVTLLTTIARQAQPWPAGVRREGWTDDEMAMWSRMIRELVEILGKSYPRAYAEAIAQLPEVVRSEYE